MYLAAKRATLMLKCAGNRPKDSDESGEQFDDEVEKVRFSLSVQSNQFTLIWHYHLFIEIYSYFIR